MNDSAVDTPPDRLDEVLVQAWALLGQGATDPASAAHLPALATVALDGRPAVRTVILRGFDAATRQLIFCTDRRARKVAEIERHGAGAIHVYDPATRVQLRLECRLAVHTDGPLTAVQWRRVGAESRPLYQGTSTPGAPLKSPGAARHDAAATRHGRANFAVIDAQIEILEWLLLAAPGHRRARFAWGDDGLAATWLVP